MCCFSRNVDLVANTRIFARPDKDGRQFVVYQMYYEATEDLAMILPLPVTKGSAEDAVKFVDLSGYSDFFQDLFLGFLPPPSRYRSKGLTGAAAPPLAVVDVGDYEASFVPTVNDFDRLDDRFRLPKGTWEKLPAYSDYGFAVFKLRHKVTHVHPMAFSFPTAYPRALFFPTVHIHDGEVHDKAGFDHTLYCQSAPGRGLNNLAWKESAKLAKAFMNVEKAKGIIAGDQHCYKLEMIGRFTNKDVTVAMV